MNTMECMKYILKYADQSFVNQESLGYGSTQDRLPAGQLLQAFPAGENGRPIIFWFWVLFLVLVGCRCQVFCGLQYTNERRGALYGDQR